MKDIEQISYEFTENLSEVFKSLETELTINGFNFQDMRGWLSFYFQSSEHYAKFVDFFDAVRGKL